MEFKTGYVTIIVPCFNGERFVHRLLDSLLNQEYKKIQLIFVNDGSTDATENIFEKHRNYLLKSNKEFNCLYLKQENKGQAVAINKALPFVDGEYLMWMDSDDFISTNHVAEKVKFLNENSKYQIVMCKGNIIHECNLDVVIGHLGYDNVAGSVFEDVLFEYCGCTGALFLIRTMDFFSIFRERKIYESSIGQNLQMLLPLLRAYKVGVLDEYLFTYLNREDSHSHSFCTYIERTQRIKDVFVLKRVLLDSMRSTFETWYNEYLYNMLKKRELQQQMDLLCSSEIDNNEKRYYAQQIVRMYSNNIKKKSECWIWGYTDKNIRLAYYLKIFCDINIQGFYDSDKKKQCDNVLSPDEIDILKDFVVIPISFHNEVLSKLNELGMKFKTDYFYLEYEIKEEIGQKREKSGYCNIPICR